MDERRKELLLAVDGLLKVHDAWAADPELQFITADYEEAVEDALAMFEAGDLPAECRRLASKMDWLQKQWDEYKQEVDAAGTVISPTGNFWRAIEGVREARKTANNHRRIALESIATLTEQKVSDNQICKMYGFLDSDGNPDLMMLREEREKPGRHTAPETGWLPPGELRRRDRETEQNQAAIRSKRRLAEKLERSEAHRPSESIEELLLAGVSGNQIARMHGCPVETVEIEAKRLGIEFAENYADVRTHRGPTEPALSDEDERAIKHWKPEGEAPQTAPPAAPKKRGRPAKPKAPPAPAEEGEEIASGQTPDEYIAELARRGVGEDSILAACQADNLRVSKSQITRIIQQVADAAEAVG